jgi:hypothetical protein
MYSCNNSLCDIEHDHENSNDTIQPRKKASEAARAVLMDWLVQNEGATLARLLAVDS